MIDFSSFNKYSYLKDFWEYSKGKEWILFGANEGCHSSGKYLINKGLSVKYFCDSNSSLWGKKLSGRKIIPPQDLKKLKDFNILIICSFINEIRKILNDIGIKGRVFNLQGIGVGARADKLFDGKIIYEHKEELVETEKILFDSKSKKTLNALIRCRLTGNYKYLLPVLSSNQYFPKDIIKLTKNETFIDGGAFDGDTIREFFSRTNGDYKKIYSFEPDKLNYQNLVNFVSTEKLRDVKCINKGLYDTNKTLSFFSFGTASALQPPNKQKYPDSIRNNLHEKVRVIALDSFFQSNMKMEQRKEIPTMIKMDIEGSEVMAIKGARKIINEFKPKLAICVYHKSTDLWEIPLLLKSINPKYEIFLRHHFSPNFRRKDFHADIQETICYAV